MGHHDADGNSPRRDSSQGIEPAAGPPASPPPATLIGRGLRCRCPTCGRGDLFVSWFTMRERCARCGLRLDRGEHDFWSGAWMLNLVGAESVFALLLGVGLVLAWPDVSWRAVTWIGVLGMLALPLLLFPVSRTLWLAIDLVLQPARESDFG